MIALSHNDKPDSFEYFNNLSFDRRVFFKKSKVINTMVYEKAIADTELDLAIDALSSGMGEGCLMIGEKAKFGGSRVSRDLIMDYLIEELGPKRLHMLKQYDKSKKEYKFSLDQNNVLKPLLNKGIAYEFLEAFISFRKHNKAAGDMNKKLIEKFNDTEIPDIMSLSYQWTRALSGRLYTNNENIQNIAKLYLSAMCGPNDDYLIVWGDFDQIDLRVAYYTTISESEEDDAIFEEYDDKYEAIARIIDKKLNREFNKENFLENRKKYKQGILARCYGQSLAQLINTVGDKDFAVMLDNYYKNNDRYTAWYNQVIDVISRGDKEVDVYTYFGNKNHVTLSDCTSNEQKADRLLNCPIQSTSNDVIMHMVNKTVKEFRRKGIDEDKFRVYMIRHDEPLFLIHKSCLEYLYIIKNNTKLLVDNWGPLTMTLDIGKFYTESEFEEYGHYFNKPEMMEEWDSNPKYNPCEEYFYDPFVHNADNAVKPNDIPIRILNDENGLRLSVAEEEFNIDTKKHLRFQLNEILADYVLSHGHETSATFMMNAGFPVDLKNIFIKDVTLYFKREVVSQDG